MNRISQCLCVAALLVTAFSLGRASAPTFQVMVNGAPSKIQVIQDKDNLMVPLTLPALDEPQQWNVSLVRDDKNRRIDVTLQAVKRKLRGGTDCYWCKATGECAQDYPSGSGLNFAGVADSNCNGTGKCNHCEGTGKL